ncbi:MAG: renalase, partial [Flavobacteriales bacterium]
MSTRWRQDGAKFDHGAQFFRVSTAEFAAELERWESMERAAKWAPKHPPGAVVPGVGDGCFVGTPTMNAPVAGLIEDAVAAGADLRRSTQVQQITASEGGGWTITVGARADALGTELRADHVVVTAPAPQVVALLAGVAPRIVKAASTAVFAPCWALMVEFTHALTLGHAVDFTAARVPDSPIAWIARESSKPGRARSERWVLHASQRWSAENLEWTREQVTPVLLEAFATFLGHPLPVVTYSSA